MTAKTQANSREIIPVSEVHTYMPELLQGKVMVVSNEDVPIECGYIIGFVEVGRSKQRWPVVRTDDNREFFGGNIVPYDEDFKSMLENKPYKERFKLLCNIVWLKAELQQIERPKP